MVTDAAIFLLLTTRLSCALRVSPTSQAESERVWPELSYAVLGQMEDACACLKQPYVLRRDRYLPPAGRPCHDSALTSVQSQPCGSTRSYCARVQHWMALFCRAQASAAVPLGHNAFDDHRVSGWHLASSPLQLLRDTPALWTSSVTIRHFLLGGCVTLPINARIGSTCTRLTRRCEFCVHAPLGHACGSVKRSHELLKR